MTKLNLNDIHFYDWKKFMTEDFSVPKGDQIQGRLTANLTSKEKRWNNVVLALCLYALTCYFSSSLLVLAILSALASVPLFFDNLKIGSFSVEQLHIFVFIGVVDLITIWYTECARSLVYALIFIAISLAIFSVFKDAKGGSSGPKDKVMDKMGKHE